MMHKKNAQMISQIFIFILAALLIGLVLLFGYRAISKIGQKADQISFIQLQTELTNEVNILAPDFGSVKIKNLDVPEDIFKVCFVTSFPDFPTISNTNYPIIEDSVNTKAENNVFLISENVKELFHIGPISVKNDFLCVDVAGSKIKIKVEGKGDHVFIS